MSSIPFDFIQFVNESKSSVNPCPTRPGAYRVMAGFILGRSLGNTPPVHHGTSVRLPVSTFVPCTNHPLLIEILDAFPGTVVIFFVVRNIFKPLALVEICCRCEASSIQSRNRT